MSLLFRDGVQGIKYLAHNDTVITISRDPTNSVLIRHIRNKFEPYVFKLGWGVRCFDFKTVDRCHLLATGSNDKVVRVWSPEVTARPASTLTGHKAGINDVKIHGDRGLVLSYDKLSTLKVWDLDRGTCFQTLPLSFPSFSVLGRDIEFGRPSLYACDEVASPYIVVAVCCEHIATVELKEEEDDEDTEDEEEIEVV